MIYLKNIRLPRLPPVDPNIDLAYLQEEGEHWLKKRQVGIETLTKNLSHDDLENHDKDGNFERFQPKIQSSILLFHTPLLGIFHQILNFPNRSVVGTQLCNASNIEKVYRTARKCVSSNSKEFGAVGLGFEGGWISYPYCWRTCDFKILNIGRRIFKCVG